MDNLPYFMDKISVEILSPDNVKLWIPEGWIFISYGKKIVFNSFKNNKVYIDPVYWDYSITTSKYRCQVLRELKPETKKKLDSGEYEFANLN